MADAARTPNGLPLLPLLLADSRLVPRDGAFPLDRIRLQKALFLVSMRGPGRWSGAYDYKPYDWGPYCRQVSRDMDELVGAGMVRAEPFPGSRYGRYTTTPAGLREAQAAAESLSAGERNFLADVRQYVTSLSFNALLREVYSEYPDYAVASKFTG